MGGACGGRLSASFASSSRKGMTDMLKRILALAGVVLLLLLFAVLLFLAVTGAPRQQLMAVLFSILFLSVLLYALQLTVRVFRRKSEK